MPYYKNVKNEIYYLDSAEEESFLPDDCVAITDAESEEIRAAADAARPLFVTMITMRQARLALLSMGLLDEVEAAITTPENQIWWDYSVSVERDHPLVNAVLTALGKTPSDIDQMFIGAAKL